MAKFLQRFTKQIIAIFILILLLLIAAGVFIQHQLHENYLDNQKEQIFALKENKQKS